MIISRQDEIVARGYFAKHQELFEGWTSREDADTDHFGGAAEAAAIFVALCGALGKISGAMDSIDKITKHTKKLITFARETFGEKAMPDSKPLDLSERLLILVFDNYVRSGKGISDARLVALTGANPDAAARELNRFEKAGVLRNGKSGWLVVH